MENHSKDPALKNVVSALHDASVADNAVHQRHSSYSSKEPLCGVFSAIYNTVTVPNLRR